MASNAADLKRKGQGQSRKHKNGQKTKQMPSTKLKQKGKSKQTYTVNRGKGKGKVAVGSALLSFGSTNQSSNKNALRKNFGFSSFSNNNNNNNNSQSSSRAGKKRQRHNRKQSHADGVEFAAPTFAAHTGLVPQRPQGELSRSFLTSLAEDLNQPANTIARRRCTHTQNTTKETGNGFSLLGNDDSESDSDHNNENVPGRKDEDEYYVEKELQRMRKRRRKEFIKSTGFKSGKEAVLLSAPTFQGMQPLVIAEKTRVESVAYSFAAPTFQIPNQEKASSAFSFQGKQTLVNNVETQASLGASFSSPTAQITSSKEDDSGQISGENQKSTCADSKISDNEWDEL